MHEKCGFYCYSQSRCTNLPTQSQPFICDKETTAESCRGDIALIRRNAPNTYQHSNSCYRLQRQGTYARTTHYDERTVSTEPLSAGYSNTFNTCDAPPACLDLAIRQRHYQHQPFFRYFSVTFPLPLPLRLRRRNQNNVFSPKFPCCVRLQLLFCGYPQPTPCLHIRHKENYIDVMVYSISNTLTCL